eukprot:TRINITY_DN3914_c0_g5_i1.p1 TRINITY_DN3914_c0_g5~~TRINITY_DN3914_c0_g5_i1.p1  ORF type:complete len:1614 (+),score=423.26 TRINITY_DN3914_c0_g5_i1:220-5061(+)
MSHAHANGSPERKGGDAGGQTADSINFGIEKDIEYLGHITQANNLVQLPRRAFASSDETHLRIWSPEGDITKKTFPSNRRSMVCKMAYCHNYSALLTAEVDMTVKVYTTAALELLDIFYLEQLRSPGQTAGENVNALAYIQARHWVLLGGEISLELWRLAKSNERRPVSIGRHEYHFRLDFLAKVGTDGCVGIMVDSTESRVVVWGRRSFSIYDLDMTPLAHHRNPHSEPMRCACIRVASHLETLLLTGGEDGAVKFWTIRGGSKREDSASTAPSPVPLQEGSPPPAAASGGRRPSGGSEKEGRSVSKNAAQQGDAALAFVQLEHAFTSAHGRPVEILFFYHRTEGEAGRRLCVSAGRDGKLKVWTLVQFSVVYSLDLPVMDMKASIFSMPGGARFCISIMQEAVGSERGGSSAKGRSATLSLMRFTSAVSTPFATTNQSPVVLIARPPVAPDLALPVVANYLGPWNITTLASEDMAIRVVDGVKGVVSTLPPPPNAKVQVLRIFFCPVWQLLILWLSSEEIAIFFMPCSKTVQEAQADLESDSDDVLGFSRRKSMRPAEGGSGDGDPRLTESTTPLLLRRFGILEVSSGVAVDQELPKEAYASVALHYGRAPPKQDAILGKDAPKASRSRLSAAYSMSMQSSESVSEENDVDWEDSDWFLFIGTKQGTLQAIRLCDVLRSCPVWERIAEEHLPPDAWCNAEESEEEHPSRFVWTASMSNVPTLYSLEEPQRSQDEMMMKRTKAFQEDYEKALEAARVPGQQPFPRDAPPLSLHGRWRVHGYPVIVTDSVGSRLMTVDVKRNLVIRDINSMESVYRVHLAPFSCQVAFLRPSKSILEKAVFGGEANAQKAKSSQTEQESTRAAFIRRGTLLTGKQRLGGLAIGIMSGHLQLYVAGEQDGSEESMLLQSHASHSEAPLQIDFSWPDSVFVSIGRDDSVKLWSRNLTLFKEIVFPQPLTAVAFRFEPTMQANAGNGDVLVGFAAHVESISRDFWSHKVPEELLGTGTSVVGNSDVLVLVGTTDRTRRGVNKLQASEDIEDHIAYLHSKEPEKVKAYLEARQGVNIGGAVRVGTFTKKMLAVAKDSKAKETKEAVKQMSEAARERLQNGQVVDFRGAPTVQIGDLCGGSQPGTAALRNFADAMGIDIGSKQHSRSEVLDQGDFQAITRAPTGYYDWSICPSGLVDGPRDRAIRGQSGAHGVAMVTSLGLGHMRSEGIVSKDDLQGPTAADKAGGNFAAPGSAFQAAAGAPSGGGAPAPAIAAGGKLSAAGGDERGGRSAQRKATSSRERRATKERKGTVSASATLAAVASSVSLASLPSVSDCLGDHLADNTAGKPKGTAASSGVASQTAAAVATTVAPAERGEEPWRRRKIGRGVPQGKEDLAPKMQGLANTEEDTARRLCERQDIAEVPEPEESNLLKSLFKVKTDWLYCEPGQELVHLRRLEANTSREMSQRLEEVVEKPKGPIWTATGRLIAVEDVPPKMSLPESYQQTQGLLPRVRRPMVTRKDVTEQRIIQAASRPPPPPFVAALGAMPCQTSVMTSTRESSVDAHTTPESLHGYFAATGSLQSRPTSRASAAGSSRGGPRASSSMSARRSLEGSSRRGPATLRPLSSAR